MLADHAHVDHAEHGSGNRTGKDGGLGSQNLKLGRREGKAADENRHGKADAAQNAPPAIMCQLTLRGSSQALSLTKANVMPKMPIGLPSSMPKYTPSVTGSVSSVLMSTPTRRTCALTNAKIGRDHKVDRCGDQALHADERRVTRCLTRSTLVVETVKVMLARDVRLVVVAVIEQRQALAQPIGEAIELDAAPWPGW